MRAVRVAYLRHQGSAFLVFEADALSKTNSARSRLLAELTAAAGRHGMHAAEAALAFNENGRLRFYGASGLVQQLAKGWLPQWTHRLSL